MTRKISVQLSEQLIERLKAAAQRRGASKSALIEAALEHSLHPDAETIDNATVLRRLNGIGGQLEQLEGDLRIVSEIVALHVRYHLTVTPPLPRAQQPAARVLGRERFEVFAAEVARRVHAGTLLMRETMNRVSETKPDLVASDTEQEVPLGPPSENSDNGSSPSNAENGYLELSAGVQEDASGGRFRGEAHNPYR